MAARRPNFWQNSGYSLLVRDEAGHLLVSDDFLRAYLSRPEIAPVEESCDKERALHAALLETPKRTVSAADIDALADPDGRDNYRVLIDFRDRLIDAGTVENCYLDVFREGAVGVAPLFLDQMAQVILRAALDGTDDAFQARAAELLFREQTVTAHEGAILAGDLETVRNAGEHRRHGLGRATAGRRRHQAASSRPGCHAGRQCVPVLAARRTPRHGRRPQLHPSRPRCALPRHGSVGDALYRRSGIHSAGAEKSAMKSGCGTSGWTPKRVQFSTIFTTTSRSMKYGSVV